MGDIADEHADNFFDHLGWFQQSAHAHAWLDFAGEPVPEWSPPPKPGQLELPLGSDKWVRVWDGRKAEPAK